MKRVVTAFFLVPVAVYTALFAPWWFLFAVVATRRGFVLSGIRCNHGIVRAAGVCGGYC